MLDYHELRCGNYINSTMVTTTPKGAYEEKTIQVQVTPSILQALENGADWYSPIELTPMILEKAEFKKDNYGLFEKVRDNKPYVSGCKIELWVKKVKEYWEVAVGDKLDGLTLIGRVKYLHQLQNIAFISGGQELPIKL